MKPVKMMLALIGLCGLALGQSAGTGTMCCVTGVTSQIVTMNSDGTLSGGWGGDIETRSPNTPSPSLKQVKAAAHKIPVSQIPTASYMKTAKAIHLKSPAMDEAELAQIIVDHGFSIYEYAPVDNYLYHQALKQGTSVRWVWKPMRELDAKSVKDQASWQTFDGMGRISQSVYAKAIPERILEKAECLLTELPEAILLVSDYEVIRPDPFLAVTTPRMLQAHHIFIVDQWDEPGFTDNPIVKPYDEFVLQKTTPWTGVTSIYTPALSTVSISSGNITTPQNKSKKQSLAGK